MSVGEIPVALVRAGVTAREAEVLWAVSARLSNREIAERLYISVRTVESHVSALLRKLDATDRDDLIERGARLRQQNRAARLPEPVTSFVGREQELADIETLLGGTRLLTLIGPGGVGKTRLALRATASTGPCPDGVVLVDFAALSSGALVTEAIAQGLGVVEQPGRALAETLRDAASHTEALVVADNCEHVIEDVARCVADLLPASELRILATSREPLGVPGETVYDVQPLAVPPSHGRIGIDDLMACDAARLFVDRAVGAAPAFTLDAANADAVAELCRRLDGLPLALELAAARVRAFSPHHLVAHLDRRFDLLTGGARTAPARHRTLAATIEWSYEALDDNERTLFQRLGVFPGSFDYEAVEAVCCYPPLDRAMVLTALPRLVDTSFVARHDTGDHGERYRLLETLRTYADQRLEAAARIALRQRHATHYLKVAQRATPHLRGPSQRTWRARLGAEQTNLRAVLTYTTETGQQETAFALLSALALYWDDTGRRRQAAEWIDRTLAVGAPPSTSTGVAALASASFLLQATDIDQALYLAETAANLAQTLGDDERATAALALGWTLAYNARTNEAITTLEAALTHYAADTHPWERATALQGLALATNDLDQAIGYAQQSAQLFEHVGDHSRHANALYTMADGALNARTRLDDAESWLRRSLMLSETAGSEHDRVHALLGLARVAWEREDESHAHPTLIECLPTLRRLGDQRCTGRVLYMLGELARRNDDPAHANELLCQCLQAAEPSGDTETLNNANHALARLPTT